MDVPQLLKLGTTSMLLWLLEHVQEAGLDFEALMDGLALANPVDALHTVSRDLTCAAPLALESGESTDAWNSAGHGDVGAGPGRRGRRAPRR